MVSIGGGQKWVFSWFSGFSGVSGGSEGVKIGVFGGCFKGFGSEFELARLRVAYHIYILKAGADTT